MARYKVKLIYHTYIEVEVDADSRTSALEKAENYTTWEMPAADWENRVVSNLSRCDEEVKRLTD